MREYERTLTTVANGYVQPQVQRYVTTLADQLREGGVAGELAILRSDGGLQSADAAIGAPVTMLLSGPAGGVTGAVWVAEQCGHRDLITFDMGGTSTDVGAGAGPQPADRPGDQGRRPHRPRLQRRRAHRRRGRRLDRARARADQGAAGRPAVRRRRPGPGGLRQGRHRADGHRRQRRPRLPADVAGRRRDHPGRRGRPRRGRQGRRGDGAGVGGGGRGRDRRHRQREHARRAAAGLGAAGLRPARLRAGRLRRRRPAARQRARRADRRLAGDRAARPRACCAPSATPPPAAATSRPAPCCAGSPSSTAATSPRCCASSPRTPGSGWPTQGLPRDEQTVGYQVDVRYHGQGFEIPVDVDPTWLDDPDAAPTGWASAFDAEHDRLFSFLLDVDHELVNARATVTGPEAGRRAGRTSTEGDGDPSARAVQDHEIYVGGEHVPRRRLRPGEAARRRRGPRSGDRHRDGLHDPRPARARGHRAPVGLACSSPPRRAERMAQIIETATGAIEKRSTSTRSPSTSSRTGCATPATRWTRCCSAPRCPRASASSTTSSR